MDTTSTTSTSILASGLDFSLGFETIDGHYISNEDGEKALLSGMAVLVGGLLVGVFSY